MKVRTGSRVLAIAISLGAVLLGVTAYAAVSKPQFKQMNWLSELGLQTY
jgi:hypothetical protein